MNRKLLTPIINERGERLIAVEKYSDSYSKAIQVSLILAYHKDGIVLVKNKQKKIWELPGGYMEPNEKASDCALRELHEESGLVGTNEKPLGFLYIECLNSDPKLLSCALFECRTKGAPFADGHETIDVMFWSPSSKVVGTISEIDMALLKGGLNGCT